MGGAAVISGFYHRGAGGRRRLSKTIPLVPVTVANPERSRQSFYRIVDPYLRFWFRFVLPSYDRLIDARGAQRHLERRVLPQLDEFVSSPPSRRSARAGSRGSSTSWRSTMTAGSSPSGHASGRRGRCHTQS
jgi:hypothetical protein